MHINDSFVLYFLQTKTEENFLTIKKNTIDDEPKVIEKVQQGKINPLRIEILRYFAQDRTSW